MRKISKILWGIAFIFAGVIFALNAFGITDIEIFFDGWGTLFIIVPCFIGIFSEREKTGNIIGLAIGVFLLLCCQNVLDFDMLWKLAIPAIIVIIGLKLILTAIFGDKATKIIEASRQNGGNVKTGCATFSGQDLNFDGEQFSGADLTAVFGSVKCDLRNAVIEKDCAITATSIEAPGQKYHLKENNKDYIFGETTAKITWGMIAQNQSDRTKWIPIIFGN